MDTKIFTEHGKFLMLALDHRESFKKLINPENPSTVSNEEATRLKRDIIRAVEGETSGILIDPELGLGAYESRSKPFLLPVERSGYTGESGERITTLEHSAQEVKSMGASGIKLLLYMNIVVPSFEHQLATAAKVCADAKEEDLPSFVEIVTYDPAGKSYERGTMIFKILETFLERGIFPDVFKLEYPGEGTIIGDITNLLGERPWILLTRGESFDIFQKQLTEVARGGAQGFLAGRALWQEACALRGSEQEAFLRETLPDRFRIIKKIMLTS